MLTHCSIVAVAFQAMSIIGHGRDVPLSEYRETTVGTFKVLFHPEATSDAMRYRRVLAALAFDVELISSRVPADALTALHEVRLVVTPSTTARRGLSGRGMCYHESAGWLVANGFDAAREGTVEVLNMDDFLARRAEQPMMLLHELAHAYHAMLGFGHPEVVMAYEAAKEAGTYDAVRYVLAAEGETRPAYARTNVREYFAELTEAWFGRNDYAPFTRDELVAVDPTGAALIGRLWALSADEIETARARLKPQRVPPTRPPG